MRCRWAGSMTIPPFHSSVSGGRCLQAGECCSCICLCARLGEHAACSASRRRCWRQPHPQCVLPHKAGGPSIVTTGEESSWQRAHPTSTALEHAWEWDVLTQCGYATRHEHDLPALSLRRRVELSATPSSAVAKDTVGRTHTCCAASSTPSS